MTLFIPTSDLLIFKTNIETDQDLATIAHIFKLAPGIKKWNVDRQDVDHVLRVEGDQIDPATVVNWLEAAGFICTELND
jgi:hypothetical protein